MIIMIVVIIVVILIPLMIAQWGYLWVCVVTGEDAWETELPALQATTPGTTPCTQLPCTELPCIELPCRELPCKEECTTLVERNHGCTKVPCNQLPCASTLHSTEKKDLFSTASNCD